MASRSWFSRAPGSTTYIDVPVGYTNLSVFATNVTLAPDLANPLELFVKLGSPPTAADTNEFEPALLNNPGPLGPGNSISIGPPLTPGRYFVGIFNPSLMSANGLYHRDAEFLGLGDCDTGFQFERAGADFG